MHAMAKVDHSKAELAICHSLATCPPQMLPMLLPPSQFDTHPPYTRTRIHTLPPQLPRPTWFTRTIVVGR